jgi:hypothetical protein
MAQPLPAPLSYLETYHQPHLSIYVPIAGYWKEAELVSSIKKQILGEIDFCPERNARKISTMLGIINRIKAEGQTRKNITAILFALPCFAAGLALSSTILVVCGVALAVFACIEECRLVNQIKGNVILIDYINGSLIRPDRIDFNRIALEMT